MYKFFFLKVWNFYTRFCYKIFSNIKNVLSIKRKIKILFIKPDTYLDLYFKNGNNAKYLVSNSYFRMGPVGIFDNHISNFLITKNNFNKKELKNYIKNLTKEKKKQFLFQKKISKDASFINFDLYDLIICFENSIDSRFIKKFKKPIWSIIYEDHRNKLYKKSIISPPKPYDIVLNQTQGFTPYSLFRQKHWVDFPYTFGNQKFRNHFKRNKYLFDVVFEVHQKEEFKKYFSKLPYKIHFLDETLSTKEYLTVLSNSKIFFAAQTKTPRWGNSLIEAALCGMLLVGDSSSFWNSLLINESLNLKNKTDFYNIIKKLLENKGFYNSQLKLQDIRLNYLNYTRPLKQLFNFAKVCERNLNIKSKI